MLINNRDFYINPLEDKRRLEKLPMLTSVNESIFDLRYKDLINKVIEEEPTTKELVNVLLDEENQNHNLYILYFNHVMDVIKNISEYSSYGLLDISVEKSKIAEFLKEFIKDDFSEENKKTIKSILNELTMDDIVYLVLSAVVAVNDEQALSYLAYNIFADGEEVDNLTEILMNAQEVVNKKKDMLKVITFEDSDNKIDENFFFRFVDSITYLYDTDFKKQIEAITPDELLAAKISKIFEGVANAIKEDLPDSSEDEDQSNNGKKPYQKK